MWGVVCPSKTPGVFYPSKEARHGEFQQRSDYVLSSHCYF
jgi:hypothetical protein